MKKLFILVLVCLLASFAVQAQRVNKNGLKMVSRVFDYSVCLGNEPDIYTFQYDENDELEKVTFSTPRNMIFKKSGNTIGASTDNPDIHFSCKLNAYGLIEEFIRYWLDNDGSGDESVEIFEFQYDYDGEQYRIASMKSSPWIAWKGKPREEWTYATPDKMEEHYIWEFNYPAPDQLMEIRRRYSMNGRVLESEKPVILDQNSEYMNDTNISICIFLGDMQGEIRPILASEWCGNNKELIPFKTTALSDDEYEQKLGFDKKGNLVGRWEKRSYLPDQIWRPRFLIEYVDGNPIETDQYGNDLRQKNE